MSNSENSKCPLTVARIGAIEELAAQPVQRVDCVNWQEFPGGPETTFQIARLGDNLCLRFAVKESNPRAVNTEDFGSVWEDSCVEFFCQLPGAERYFNFEFNSLGVCVATSRLNQTDGVIHLSDEQMASIKRTPCVEAEQWSLLVEIPLAIISPDNLGEQTLMVNFYKCGDLTDEPHFLSWSPIDLPKPLFHCPRFFVPMHVL